MINAELNFSASALDFDLQRSDPRVQLFDGQRIEILPRQQPYRIIGPVRQIVVHVHDADC